MRKEVDAKLATVLLLIIILIFISFVLSVLKYEPLSVLQRIKIPFFNKTAPLEETEELKLFSSEEDFKSYLDQVDSSLASWGGGLQMAREIALEEGFSDSIAPKGMGGAEPERFSETNVQVTGIDEPDIVKTDGKEIYFSPTNYYRRWSFGSELPIYPNGYEGIKAIKAFPVKDLALDSEIEETGEMLLAGDSLLVLSRDGVSGYDVSNPKSPSEKWTMELKDQTYIIAARLMEDKVYLVSKTNINRYNPCPIRPFSIDGEVLDIRCTDIYHPTTPVPVDVTYNAIILDPQSGKIDNKISFVGSSALSVIYMSNNALYTTYYYPGDFIEFFAGFFSEKCRDLINYKVIKDIEELAGYDISDTAKMTELGVILNEYISSLNTDERLRIENELTNRLTDYYRDNKRKLERTGIIKIGLDDFEILASGNVPGKPLNQFSLDEYENHLRIAVTVGESFFGGIPVGAERESANDVYVLNDKLVKVGSVLDLGEGERIYSARFIGDKGYLVTFRQIDPFYVLDLSNSSNPSVEGELKIPGYSSYLHPVNENRILGIGKEGSRVKLSLFDVESPKNPKEVSKYNLDEYWSDILNTHHAFLLDEKHEIFFLPGGKGGYVFSFERDDLELIRAVSGIMAKRAIYIDDYLYIIGDDKIKVLNELNWEEVNKLDL